MRRRSSTERAFSFIPLNERQRKPRTRGITEIRGPYYTPMGKHYLEDLLGTMGQWIHTSKFAGGSFALMPRDELVSMIECCHRFDVQVSTGGFIERVLLYGPHAVDRYIQECRAIGSDILEISTGFVSLPIDDALRLVERVHKAGLKAKPEVGIQFGAGGASSVEALEAEGTRDVEWVIAQAERYLDGCVDDHGRVRGYHRERTELAHGRRRPHHRPTGTRAGHVRSK